LFGPQKFGTTSSPTDLNLDLDFEPDLELDLELNPDLEPEPDLDFELEIKPECRSCKNQSARSKLETASRSPKKVMLPRGQSQPTPPRRFRSLARSPAPSKGLATPRPTSFAQKKSTTSAKISTLANSRFDKRNP
jgi:hypothetical protein